jgi:hypothetical protein
LASIAKTFLGQIVLLFPSIDLCLFQFLVLYRT